MSYYILITVIIIAIVLMMMMMMMMVVIIIIITVIIILAIIIIYIITIIILTIFSLTFTQVLIVLETKHFITLVWTKRLSAPSLVHSQDLTLQESATKCWLFKADFPQWLAGTCTTFFFTQNVSARS